MFLLSFLEAAIHIFLTNLKPPAQFSELINNYLFYGTVSRDFLIQVFFHESPSPKPLIIALGSFQIFLKIRGVKVHHRYQRFPLCCWHRWQIATGINDTGGKFATVVFDTGGK